MFKQVQLVDLIICGSVAVNRRGARLGKGAGYSDIEVALLQEAGLVGPNTTSVTTVHSLQVLDEELPETEHDFRVDVIVTSDEKIAAIPVLAARHGLSTKAMCWGVYPGINSFEFLGAVLLNVATTDRGLP